MLRKRISNQKIACLVTLFFLGIICVFFASASVKIADADSIWKKGVNTSGSSGHYTLTGDQSSVETINEYKDFELIWTVVKNTTITTNPKYNRSLRLDMGMVSRGTNGYDFTGDPNAQGKPKGKIPFTFYMSPAEGELPSPLQIDGVNQFAPGTTLNLNNRAGTSYRFLVYEGTLSLFTRTSENQAWEEIFTFRDIYMIGTLGKVRLEILDGGEYEIKDLSIKEYTISDLEKTGEYTIYTDIDGNIYKTTAVGRTAVKLNLTTLPSASVRLNDHSGIRFTYGIEKVEYDKLGLAEENITFGSVIGYKENVGEQIKVTDIKIANVELDKSKSWYRKTIGDTEYRCYNVAITNIDQGYYHRDFVTRNYAIINFLDGTSVTLYSSNSHTANVSDLSRALLPQSSDQDERNILNKFAGTIDNNGKVMKEEESDAYYIEALGKDRMPIVVYVGPTRGGQANNIEYANLINDQTFKTLADMGVNVILGHGEYEEEINVFFKYCEKYNMVFLPQYDYSKFAKWDGVNNKIVTYDQFSAQDKQTVKADFENFLNKYKDSPSFAGVHVADEPGYEMIPSLKAMKGIFDSICPEKLFYVNMHMPNGEGMLEFRYNPYTSQARDGGLGVAGRTWESVVTEFSTELDLDIMSYDAYLFHLDAGRDRAMSSEQMYDYINRFSSSVGAKPMWFFTFTGHGTENGITGAREQDISETRFQMHAPLSAGITGLEMFPPIKTLGSKVVSLSELSLFDKITGEKTQLVDVYKEIYKQIRACQQVLVNSAYKGYVISEQGTTEYYYTMLHGFKSVDDVPNAGSKPTGKILSQFNQLKGIETDSTQIVAGCYNYKGYTALYVVNNAVRTTKEYAKATLNLSGVDSAIVLQEGLGRAYTGVSLTGKLEINIKGGEGVLVVLGTTTINVD